jgi:hypothetical protein
MNESVRALHYYYANQEAINNGHVGEFVAIHDNQVVGYYKNYMAGCLDMLKRFPVMTFNVCRCVKSGEPMWDLGGIEVSGETWTF